MQHHHYWYQKFRPNHLFCHGWCWNNLNFNFSVLFTSLIFTSTHMLHSSYIFYSYNFSSVAASWFWLVFVSLAFTPLLTFLATIPCPLDSTNSLSTKWSVSVLYCFALFALKMKILTFLWIWLFSWFHPYQIFLFLIWIQKELEE